MDTVFFWLVIFIASLLAEVLLSPGLFYFLSFSLASGGAAGASYLGFGILHQFIIFFGTLMCALLFLSFVITRVSKDTLHKSNVYALIGKQAMVTETISSCAKGWVKVDGELWSAASLDGLLIEKGSLVEIVDAAGSHLKVRKIKGHC